jgi:hypothetical protein
MAGVVELRVEWEVFTGAAREDLYTPKDRCCLVNESSIVNHKDPSRVSAFGFSSRGSTL